MSVNERTSSSHGDNPFAALIPNQRIAVVSTFQLESGQLLHNVPVAFTTRGILSPSGDNAMVICHALSGSADVEDWWGPLLGASGKAFDTSRFYVVCLNSLGSPYGTASPVTHIDDDPHKGRYGPDFPLTTIRDDVRLHQLVLDFLGIKQIAAVVGGSMGGMQVLEYAYSKPDYVRCIVPIATSSQHSAWGISWGEAQRQCIYSDPKYLDGFYPLNEQPTTGLGAARMQALLTYRSRDSFENRFGRSAMIRSTTSQQSVPARSANNSHFIIHNDGHRTTGNGRPSQPSSRVVSTTSLATLPLNSTLENNSTDPAIPTSTSSTISTSGLGPDVDSLPSQAPYFSAQSYLRYQAQKFTSRFDSNCYIAITRKLDTHDLSLHASPQIPDDPGRRLTEALGQIQQPSLIIGIESDGLFTFAEQEYLAATIPNARLRTIDSPEGHDAFLLQFEQVNEHILAFFHDVIPDIMAREGTAASVETEANPVRESLFGEREGVVHSAQAVDDIIAW